MADGETSPAGTLSANLAAEDVMPVVVADVACPTACQADVMLASELNHLCARPAACICRTALAHFS